jgi:site-specific DNA recombinase
MDRLSIGEVVRGYCRCVGTDTYRFGGQRICDNLQVRTDRLDDLVWQQVVELLRHPERLKNEYERRLDMMERHEKRGVDTGNLEKQRLQLEKGKSRLIDSYADGVAKTIVAAQKSHRGHY